MFLENVRTALEALFGNRLRSILTLLGVVIGVFAVTTTISMGAIATAGMQATAMPSSTRSSSNWLKSPTKAQAIAHKAEAISAELIVTVRP